MAETGGRFSFIAEWLDTRNDILWTYTLRHYPESREVELLDAKGRLFLKRTVLPEIKLEQLVLGTSVTVFARQLRLVGYADEITAAAFQDRIERTLALLKPDGMSYIGDILCDIAAAKGLQISRMRMCQLSQQEAERFYAVHRQQPFFPALTQFMSSGPIMALELVGDGAVSAWRRLLGPTDSEVARQQAPDTIRARWGTNNRFNAAHGSDSPSNAVTELEFFFGRSSACSTGRGPCMTTALPGQLQPLLQGTVLCLVKPHAVREGHAGGVLAMLQQHGFQVTTAESFVLDRQQATRFHEVYRGVVSPAEFEGMVIELSSGPCLALEVSLPDGEPALEPLRTLCGPSDPELARAARPASLRAQFGASAAKNAVHCTDLAEDAVSELAFFFLGH